MASKCPVAVSENRHTAAVGTDAIDVHGIAANHEILVNHGIIDTQCPALLQCFFLEIVNGIRKAHAQGQVAGGILVE